MRLELIPSAWKADHLPLIYTRTGGNPTLAQSVVKTLIQNVLETIKNRLCFLKKKMIKIPKPCLTF